MRIVHVHIGSMNEAMTSTRPRISILASRLVIWLIDPSLQKERGEVSRFRVLKCKFGGGLVTVAMNHFVNPDHSGIQLCFGILRFHVDIDFIFISSPENEVRNDKRINKFKYKDEHIEYKSSFFGYEGVGLFRKYSLAAGTQISQLEFGAHPMCAIGFTNVHNLQTQRAVIGIQFANLQVGIHSAIDLLQN
jgi:hypothetical protein